MKTKNEQQFIVTTYKDCGYITAGKHYEVKKQDEDGYMYIVSDIGAFTLCAPVGCACNHLGRTGTWKYVTE